MLRLTFVVAFAAPILQRPHVEFEEGRSPSPRLSLPTHLHPNPQRRRSLFETSSDVKQVPHEEEVLVTHIMITTTQN